MPRDAMKTTNRVGERHRRSSGVKTVRRYELFELACILRVRPQQTHKTSAKGRNHSNLSQIQSSDWLEIDGYTLLVLLSSNGSLLLWSCEEGTTAVVKQIPWYQSPSKAIKAFTLDPTGSWLVCACADAKLYIVPIASVVKRTTRPSARSYPWSLSDITCLKANEIRGIPSSVVWWHTVDDFDICVVGTEAGELLFVDLKTAEIAIATDVKESITMLELIHAKSQEIASLLVSSISGETWQIVLESRTLRRPSQEASRLSPGAAYALGYEMVGKMAVPLFSLLGSETKNMLERLKAMPVKTSGNGGDVTFSVQHARNQVFIGAHNQRTDVFEVYDVDADQLPMFVYQLHPGTLEIVLTDRLLFTVIHGDENQKAVYVLSSQLAETSISSTRSTQRSLESSVIQIFRLPNDEQVVGVYKISKTFDSILDHHTSDNTEPACLKPEEKASGVCAVDGCVIVTSAAVYECRPRLSPENLFLDLAVHNTDTNSADLLAITVGLDVNALYQLAADQALDEGLYDRAIKLYQLSKCPFPRRVAQFAKHGRISDILAYLRQTLSKHSDAHTAERKQLSNLALYCFVQQILESGGDMEAQSTLAEAFSQFINDNFDYDERCALELLSVYGLKEYMFDVAKARGLMSETLDLLASKGQFHLPSHILTKLASRGFTDIVSRSCNGSFLQCMDPADAVKFILAKPETILSHVTQLMNMLMVLEEDMLVRLSRVTDPSRPSFRTLASQIKRNRRGRSLSVGSISSLSSLDSTASLNQFQEDHRRGPSLMDLVQLFLSAVLVLNYRREQRIDCKAKLVLVRKVLDPRGRNVDNNGRKKEGYADTAWQQQMRLACGQQHTAVVSSTGDVYTWGKSQKGRLGHGDLIEEEGKSVPFRVEILHMHRIKVLSVACGVEHTLALCKDGVYAWGSSEFGQLGQGDNQQHTRPVYITELSGKECIAVSCGHYHSMALCSNNRMWTWGWGVHGQLGLGTIEDALLPSHVSSLTVHDVIQMAAGYSHTVVLTSEGKVLAFGAALYGQIGHGSNVKQRVPVTVEALRNERVYLICCGSFETIAVTEDQKVYNWGRNPDFFRFHMRLEFRTKRQSSGKDSGTTTSHRFVPVQMDCSLPSKIKQIQCGNWHYLALTESGEVYTWGFNDHGQLGHNVKKDHQVVPRLLHKLQERYITSVSVGAEFSVAMDSGGQVFVWGRADAGQLGLDVGSISSSVGSKKEVSLPTLLSNLPQLNRKLSTSSEHTVAGERSLDIDWDLPDLSAMGDNSNPYDREALLVAINRLQDHYNPETVLRYCLEIKDYLSASVIAENLHQWPEATRYRLKFLKGCIASQSPPSCALSVCRQVIQQMIRKFKDDGGNVQEVSQTKPTLWVLEEVLRFWSELRLPQTELENLLMAHLDLFGYPLSLIYVRDPAISMADALSQSTGIQPSSSSFGDATASSNGYNLQLPEFTRLPFSAHFLYQVVCHVADQVDKGMTCLKYQNDLSATRCHGENNGKTSPSLPSDGTPLTMTSSKMQAPDGRIWQEIMDNIKKDLDRRSCITLSLTTAATIAAAAVSQRKNLPEQAADQLTLQPRVDVVVFTCSHQFPKYYFDDVIIPEFQQRMGELVIPLPQLTKLLIGYYTSRDSFLPTACPSCVYNFLRKEQLQAVDIENVEFAKAKPWEI